MKREIDGAGKNPKPRSSPFPKATPLPITQNDAAGLVGGIVEKGFSEIGVSGPSSSPRPSVLPFPVARHRSHGPHWGPVKAGKLNVIGHDVDDEEDGQGEDLDGMDWAADTANPVTRKEKKGIDFSHWQDILRNDASLPPRKKKNETDLPRMKISRKGDGKSFHSDHVNQQPMDISFPKHKASNVHVHKLVTEGGDDLESQIDAENRARLSKMSEGEIAEAQAEILGKLNPKLMHVLKNRAQAKVTTHKFPLPDVGALDDMEHKDKMLESGGSSDSSLSHKPVEKLVRDTPDNALPDVSAQTGSIWDSWRKRVEQARDFRFSLDGDIVNSDSESVLDSGNTSTQSGYNADNVSERDFIRTEGDPGAAGYTIKEAIALTRSVVPGQRAIALSLIASVLDRAIVSISQDQVCCIDWEAIWAFALGPEPELVLTLRMGLDDNHNSVVIACVKAIQSALSCEMNEIIFDISEKTPTYLKDVCTAPVFRSKPDVNVGFLRGGFWKYNAKPSNICDNGEESMDVEPENERTIQDDIVVAGQDIAAGLVRMGILPRICYLLETDPAASLEECLISILIALARHSPTSAAAIVNCERLVQTVVNRFSLKEHVEINCCKIKSVILLKVLARTDKMNCLRFIQGGLFHKVTWQLYRYPFSLNHWLSSGKEACRLSSALLVEQLRLWKVCIKYGCCLSEFPELLTSLCTWLGVPTIDKLIEENVMNEYFAVTKEIYLLLDVFARRLPNFYSPVNEQNVEAACTWGQFGLIIDPALEWMEVKSIPHVSRFFDCSTENPDLQGSELNSFLWVFSSVLNLLSTLLKALISEDTTPNCSLSWLPHFVPKLGLKIKKNGFLRFSSLNNPEGNLSGKGSVVEYLCNFRHKNGQELAISSTCCLQGLVQVVASVDKLIQMTNLEIHREPSKFVNLSSEDKILANGILKSSAPEVQDWLTNVMNVITSESQSMQLVEKFNRGGPAPGVGVGWGAYGGGYWSLKTLLAQQDASLLSYLLEVAKIPSPNEMSETGDEFLPTFQKLNCALAACLLVGPGNGLIVDKLLNFIFQAPLLKYLDIGIRKFLRLRKDFEPFKWNYEEEEFLSFASVLSAHYTNRWLDVKKRKATNDKSSKNPTRLLETIHEDSDAPDTEESSLIVEWAHQRLPLHEHWFLSAISTIHTEKNMPLDFLEVAKGGLFFLLAIEAIPSFITNSPIVLIPVVWKLHAFSVVLLSGMGILEDEKSRDIYENLQNVYGETIDKKGAESMRFLSNVHQNYSTFVENLVDQFAAESYGDFVFGRQVAAYLHKSVETSVRLSAWNALSNARALELLPPIDKCFLKAEGFLEPAEDDERMLEAYVKSWVSGALDKAATRRSMTSSLVLHHLSFFIFESDMLSLRNKLVKSLLRDCSRKEQHEKMMVSLIFYKKSPLDQHEEAPLLALGEIEKRLEILNEICEGNSSLISIVQKLESRVKRDVAQRMMT